MMNKVFLFLFLTTITGCAVTANPQLAISGDQRPSSLLASNSKDDAPTKNNHTSDTNLQRSFQLGRSSQVEFAKNRRVGTFYVALEAIPLRQDIGGSKCVDQSFFSWVRKIVKKDSAKVAIVAGVKGPNEKSDDFRKIPLFEVSKDESSEDGPKCLADILQRKITPYYLIDKEQEFQLEVDMLVEKNPSTSAIEPLIQTAGEVLDFTGGSASLVKKLAEPSLIRAAKKVDESINDHWSFSNQKKYRIEVRPWPRDGNWEIFKDQAVFSVQGLVSSSIGVDLTGKLLPSVLIRPVYLESLLGDGVGKYLDEARILKKSLVSQGGDDLDKILLNGIEGFNTSGGYAIKDATSMKFFCRQMKLLFADFLTEADALAARYAVLKVRTDYMLNDDVQGEWCIDDKEKEKLKELRSSFIVTESRGTIIRRDELIKRRMNPIVGPLRANHKDGFVGHLVDPETFSFKVSRELVEAFPQRDNSHSWGGKGTQAIEQLMSAGGFRVGCYGAHPEKSLRYVPAVALNKKTGASAGLIVEFEHGDDQSGAVKIKALDFQPIEFVKRYVAKDNWPESGCVLL